MSVLSVTVGFAFVLNVDQLVSEPFDGSVKSVLVCFGVVVTVVLLSFVLV